MVERLNENRQRALAERSGQAGTPDVRTQNPTVSAQAGRRGTVSSDGGRERVGLRDRMANARSQAAGRPERPSVTTPPVVAARQQAERTASRHRDLDSRLTDYRQRRSPSTVDPSSPRGSFSRDHRDSYSRRPSYVHARYYDRPDLIRHDYRRTHTYYDHRYRLHHRVVWPHYRYPIYYRFGHHVHFRHVYPYYHRKYVFISLGGFWPGDYSYVRYYWYGWHPYVWYGYYPIAREVGVDNYNYYTYNYYNQNTDGAYTSYSSETPVENEMQAVDQSTWADVRQKLDQQADPPAAPTVSDTRFEEGVKSFEAGNYDAAADKFEEAMRLSPNDMILPFAYAQALFADGKYTESAAMLRKALGQVTPEKEGVFYPRGLYANDDVLYAQIENLVDKLEDFGYDADMQLLLGYHLLGTGETGYAREPLERASQDLENAESAKVLLRLADKIESEAKAANLIEGSGAATEGQTEGKAEAAPSSDAQPSTEGVPPSNAPSDVPNEGTPQAQPQAAPQGEKPDPAPGADEASPLTEPKDKDRSSPGIVPLSGAGSSGKGSGRGQEAGIAAASRLSWLSIAGFGRYLRADFAVFAGIVLLGWAGVYAQWRLPHRS
jgi:tetratricopeptide (TPR) repeat protein